MGELQRRITKLLEEGNFEYIGAVGAVIEIAKKEFPFPHITLATEKDTIRYPLKEWFEKWFSE